MMIARGSHEGRELIIFGLSKENVERLMKGAPMTLSRETHGEAVPAGWDVLICYGVTEADIVAKMRAAGLVCAETKANVNPRLFS